jgi:hypothetical protein
MGSSWVQQQQRQPGQVLLALTQTGGCHRCHMHMVAGATAAITGLLVQQQQRQAAGCVKVALQLAVHSGIACLCPPHPLGRAGTGPTATATGPTVTRSSSSICTRLALPRVKAFKLAMRLVHTTALLL